MIVKLFVRNLASSGSTLYASGLVLMVMASLSGCGGGTIASIGLREPHSLARGERIATELSIRFQSAERSYASRKMEVQIDCDDESISVEPTKAEVTLDDKGAAVVPIYIEATKQALPGERTLKFRVLCEQGRLADSWQATITIK